MDISDLKNLPKPDISSIFDLRQQVHTGAAARETATFFRDQQKVLWLRLLGGPDRQDSYVSRIFSVATGALQQDDLFVVVPDNEGFAVFGKIPLLTEQKVAKALASFNARTLAAAILVECKNIFQGQQLAQILDIDLFTLVLSYSNGGLSPGEIQPYVTEKKATLAGLESSFDKIADNARTKISSFSVDVAELLIEKSGEIDALKKTVAESIRLSSSATLWRTKAIWHQVGFVFWFAIFAAITCAVGWYIAGHISQIATNIPKDKDGVITYYSLVFFIVPVLAIAWLLRLLSRFINNQLVLLDDARHRDVMTKTYLALVADKESRVDEKDRLVMLSAIFRPLPGAQPEDLAPPTILDLLKKS